MANTTPAEEIIKLFGGIRPTAAKLDTPVTTVQGWKKRGFIPEQRYDLVLAKAEEHGLKEKVSFLLSEQTTDSEKDEGKTESDTHSKASESAKEKSTDSSGAAHEYPHSAGKHDDENDAYKPKPMPQYMYTPENQKHWVASFTVSMASAVLALAILAILFFAPDILPFVSNYNNNAQTEQPSTAYYRQQNKQLEERISQYDDKVENMTNRIHLLVKATQQMQNDISALRQNNEPKRLIEMEQSLSAIRQSNEELRQTVQSLQAVGGTGTNETTIENIQRIVDAVNDRIETMQKEIDSTRTVQSSLSSNMDTLQTQDMAYASMILSANNINDAIGTGESFDSELNVLKMLFGFDENMIKTIQQLEPHASKGIQGPEGMVRMLEMLSDDIINAEYQGQDRTMKEKALRELNNMVSIRRAGELPAGESTEAIVARAKVHLEQSNVQAALQELEKIESNAAKNVAEPLTSEIQAYLIANTMIDQLSTTLAEYVPPKFMQAIVVPWLKTTKDAAQLKFPDPKDIQVEIPYKIPSDGGKSPYQGLLN